jgi:hypothetical protein
MFIIRQRPPWTGAYRRVETFGPTKAAPVRRTPAGRRTMAQTARMVRAQRNARIPELAGGRDTGVKEVRYAS